VTEPARTAVFHRRAGVVADVASFGLTVVAGNVNGEDSIRGILYKRSSTDAANVIISRRSNIDAAIYCDQNTFFACEVNTAGVGVTGRGDGRDDGRGDVKDNASLRGTTYKRSNTGAAIKRKGRSKKGAASSDVNTAAGSGV
jgi:hypothetical protein